MKRISMGQALVATAAMITGAGVANAADLYTMNIKTSFVISGSCTFEGQAQSSQVLLAVDGAEASNPKELTQASVQIRVCSPFAGARRETFPIPFPMALIKASGKVKIGEAFDFTVPESKKLRDAFPKNDPPDYLYVQKTADNVFSLTYIEKKTNRTRIGPVRVMLAPAKNLKGIPGFDESKHLNVSGMEVEVPSKGITLKADLKSVTTK